MLNLITKAFGLVTGGYGPLIAVGVLLLVTNAGTAYVTHGFDNGTLEALKAADAKQAAEDNAKALAQLQRHTDASQAQVTDMIKAVAARDAQNQSLREAINAKPKTRSCVDSPAIRTLLDGIRNNADGLRAGADQRH